MIKQGKPVRQRHELRVRRRDTIEPGPVTSTDGTVHCPRREATTTLKECLECPSCLELREDEDGRHLVCEYEDYLTPGGAPLRRRRRPTEGDKTPLSAVMSADLVCVSPELSIREVVTLLADRGFSGVPVVDATGRPIGILSKSDLLDAGREGTVRDLMMPIAFTMPETASLSHAAALMAYENVHRLPIIANDGTVVGIVSAMDIVRWVAEQDGYVVGRTR